MITPARSQSRRSRLAKRSRGGTSSAGSPSTFSPRGRQRLEAVRDRAEPPQGRHRAPVPDLAVSDGRRLRRRARWFPNAHRAAEVLRVHRWTRVRGLPIYAARRRLRPRPSQQASLRPHDRDGAVPHADRARPARVDRRHRGQQQPEEARTLFERTRDAFDREARAASRAPDCRPPTDHVISGVGHRSLSREMGPPL